MGNLKLGSGKLGTASFRAGADQFAANVLPIIRHRRIERKRHRSRAQFPQRTDLMDGRGCSTRSAAWA